MMERSLLFVTPSFFSSRSLNSSRGCRRGEGRGGERRGGGEERGEEGRGGERRGGETENDLLLLFNVKPVQNLKVLLL